MYTNWSHSLILPQILISLIYQYLSSLQEEIDGATLQLNFKTGDTEGVAICKVLVGFNPV